MDNLRRFPAPWRMEEGDDNAFGSTTRLDSSSWRSGIGKIYTPVTINMPASILAERKPGGLPRRSRGYLTSCDVRHTNSICQPALCAAHCRLHRERKCVGCDWKACTAR